MADKYINQLTELTDGNVASADKIPIEDADIPTAAKYATMTTLKNYFIDSPIIVETVKAEDGDGLYLYEDGGVAGIHIEDSGDVALTNSLSLIADEKIYLDNTNIAWVGADSSGNVEIKAGTSGTHVYIKDSTGNFGIGTSTVPQRLTVSGSATVSADVYVGDQLFVRGDATINGSVYVSGGATLNTDVYIGDDLIVTGNATLNSNVYVDDDLTVSGNSIFSGDVTVTAGGANLFLVDASGYDTTDLIFVDTSATVTKIVYDSVGGDFDIDVNNVDILRTDGFETVMNEDGIDLDFRVESENKPYMMFINAGADRIGLGTATPSVFFHTVGNTKITGKLDVTNNATLNSNVTVGGDVTISAGGPNLFLVDGSGYDKSEIYFIDTSATSGKITYDSVANDFDIEVNDIDIFRTDSFEVVINEGSADVDFRVESDSSANAFFIEGGTSRVGIGTNSPLDKLHIYDGDLIIQDPSGYVTSDIRFVSASATTGTIVCEHSGSGAIAINLGGLEILGAGSEIVINEDSQDLNFRVESDGNANALFIDGGNNRIGIGTGNPSDKLHIYDGDLVIQDPSGYITSDIRFIGASATTSSIVCDHSGGMALMINMGSSEVVEITDGSIILNDGGNSFTYRLETSSGGANSFYIDDDGNVGLGIGNPLDKLHIYDGNIIMDEPTGYNNVYVRFLSSAATTSTIVCEAGGGNLTFDMTGTDIIELTSSTFTVNEDSNDVDFRVESNNNAYMLFLDAGNDRIGIATSNPSVTLDIVGNTDITGTLTVTGNITATGTVDGVDVSAHAADSTIHYTQASITATGTITSGTWSANAIIVGRGGTGATSFSANKFLYYNSVSGVMEASSYWYDSFAVAANGVTNGNSHDHNGGDGAQISHSSLGSVTADQHHAQSHTHGSHTSIGANDHHAQVHAITSHTGTLLVGSGGTGAGSFTANKFLYYNSVSTVIESSLYWYDSFATAGHTHTGVYQPLDADLTALAALGSTGVICRTGDATYAQRVIGGTTNEITVTNGGGVAASPTIGGGGKTVVIYLYPTGTLTFSNGILSAST